MSILRWFVSIFMALVLAIVLLISLPTTAAIQQVTSVQTIKTWLQESNFYQDFLTATFEELARDIFASTETFPLISNRQVLEEVENSLPDRFVQNTFETILDAYYGYFQGRKDTVTFNISLVEIRDNLKTNIPRLLKETIANFPPCIGNSQQDYEQFERGECLPSEVDVTELYRAIDNAIQSEIVFDDSNLTAEDLNVSYEELQPIRRGFQILRSIPTICYGLMLLFSTIILIATPRPIKKGLLVLGLTWIPCTFIVGAISLSSRSLSLQLMQALVRESSPNIDPIVHSLLLNFFITAYQSISDRILLLSGVGFAFGIACIVLSVTRFSTAD
ncbi:MAG: hypothetical protein J7647_28995 [Cyanobacteria bacterium SBLK]|nr:hypothetical protein [Cyanobacteria bacterium SBLK]